MSKGYLVRDIAEVEPVPCPCGWSRRPISIKDTSIASIYVTSIADSQKHYHKQTCEFYYILEGTGTMELGEEKVALKPGVVIMIAKLTPHRGYGDFKALIVGVPALQEKDEFFTDTK